jgi:predicted secreted protein
MLVRSEIHSWVTLAFNTHFRAFLFLPCSCPVPALQAKEEVMEQTEQRATAVYRQ